MAAVTVENGVATESRKLAHKSRAKWPLASNDPEGLYFKLIRKSLFLAYKAILDIARAKLRPCDLTLTINPDLADLISESGELAQHVDELWHRGMLARNSRWQLGDTLYGFKLIVSEAANRTNAVLSWGDNNAIPCGAFTITDCL